MREYSSKILELNELVIRVDQEQEEGHTVALANGAFDLIHVGHIRYLQGAGQLADVLVVAVNDDGSVRRLKGPGRPIFPLQERLEILVALEVVDFAVSFSQDHVGEVIRALKPDIHVKGTDYRPEIIPEREMVTVYGGRMAVAGDPKDHSTTDIIARLTKGK